MKTKQYNLVLTQEMFDTLQTVAKEEHTSMLELIRRGLSLLFFLLKKQKSGATIVVRTTDGSETEVVLY